MALCSCNFVGLRPVIPSVIQLWRVLRSYYGISALNKKHRSNSLKFRFFLVQENLWSNRVEFWTYPHMYISTGLLFQAMIPKSHSSTLEGSADRRLDLRREWDQRHSLCLQPSKRGLITNLNQEILLLKTKRQKKRPNRECFGGTTVKGIQTSVFLSFSPSFLNKNTFLNLQGSCGYPVHTNRFPWQELWEVSYQERAVTSMAGLKD